MKLLLLLSAALYGVSAYPTVEVEDRPWQSDEAELGKRHNPAFEFSKHETNCGPTPCKEFDAEKQFISTTGKHAWQSPSITDIRGPCPGLNAAANNGYLPRNGILSIADTTFGLFRVYGLSHEFNAFLAVYAIITSGDIVGMSWSIGGPQPYINPGGVLSPPQGISYAHNKYEGDASIARADAYMNNGDAHSLNMTRFLRAFEIGMDDNRYTLHKFRKGFVKNIEDSIHNNPYYFSPPFAGAAVPPAAYNFVINFMSNHTKEEPSGYLDAYNFKSFFAVAGKYPNMRWLKGQEAIPPNWYKREIKNPYGAIQTVNDVVIGALAFPKGFRIGGNTNGANTYQGIDLSQLTGGTITDANVLKGNNLGCLFFQSAQQAIPDELKGGVNSVAEASKLFKKFGGPIIDRLGCKPLGHYDSGVFDPFPGHTYNPTGKATNY